MGPCDSGHVAVPELIEGGEDSIRVPRIVREEEVDIAGQSHVTVENHRLPTDDEVPDSVGVKELDERTRVRREVVRVYPDGWHSRTSLLSWG